RSTSAAARARAVSLTSVQVRVRHSVRPSAWSLYAGWSPYCCAVRVRASRTICPSTDPRMSSRSSVVSVSVMAFIVAPRPTRGKSGERCSQAQRTPDDLLLDLGGAPVDRLDPGVHEGPGDRVLRHVAVAAVELHGAVGDRVLQLGGPPLR